MSQNGIAIVGAGFAGLATALLLARDGHHVTVFEKFAEPKAVGAGVLIQPTGLAALRVLGIEQEMLQAGARVSRLLGVTPRGRRVVDISYADWRQDAFGLGLHRGALFGALWRECQAAGVRLEAGREITSLPTLAAQYGLVVVVDGAHSLLRAMTGLRVHHRVYPWGALWAILPDSGSLVSREQTLFQWYDRASKMLGIMPTGVQPGQSDQVLSIFWSLHGERRAEWQARGLDAWKEDVMAMHPGAEQLLSHIYDQQQLTWAHYADVVMPRYHKGNVVVIGDAAHATSPQLGQGTNLALLDAVTLSQCIRQVDQIETALERYSACRRRHLHYYSQMSRLLTPLFQSDQQLLPWLRDMLMATSLRMPVAGAMNLQTLVGVRGGWLHGEAREWLFCEK